MKRLENILIIDDEEDIRLVVKSHLKREGYKNIDEAENGEVAVKLVENNKYDLIICDIRMEKMDGIEFLHSLRERNNSTWFLFLSGYLDEKALRSGTFLYIEKPFTKANLIFTVKRVELLRSLFLEYDEIFEKISKSVDLIEANKNDSCFVSDKVDEIKAIMANKSDYIYSLYFNDEVKIISV